MPGGYNSPVSFPKSARPPPQKKKNIMGYHQIPHNISSMDIQHYYLHGKPLNMPQNLQKPWASNPGNHPVILPTHQPHKNATKDHWKILVLVGDTTSIPVNKKPHPNVPPRNSDSRIPSQNPPLTGHFWGLDLKGKKGPLNQMIRWSFVTSKVQSPCSGQSRRRWCRARVGFILQKNVSVRACPEEPQVSWCVEIN